MRWSSSDPYENLGAQLAKEVATKTNDVAGDGTTTATVLAQAMVREGLRNVAAGATPMSLKRGIDTAVEAVAEPCSTSPATSTTRTTIAHVATISAQDAHDRRADRRGVRQGRQGRCHHRRGVQHHGPRARVHRGHAVRQGLHLAVHRDRRRSAWRPSSRTPTSSSTRARSQRVAELLPLLEKVVQAGKPLLIVAEDVEGEALSTLVVNKIRGTFNAVAVKAPAFGDRRKAMLQDIAILTGGQVVPPEVGLKLDQVGLDVLGQRPPRRVTKDDTTIVDGAGDADAVEDRVNQIRPRSSRPTPTGTARSSRSAWPSWPAASASSRSARPPRSSSRRRSTASRTPSPRRAPRSRRASSPAAAPRSCTPSRCSVTASASPATRPPACASCAKSADEPLRWIAENGGDNGYVVVAKVREGGPARATTPRPRSTATWSPRASSTRSR